MFIREKHRSRGGSGHPYLVLVESRATPKGTRQRIILSLGRMELSRQERAALADMVSRRLAGQQSVLDEPEGLKMLADGIATKVVERRSKGVRQETVVAPVDWKGRIRLQWVKEIGSVAVFEHFWNALGVTDVLGEIGVSESELLRVKLGAFCKLVGLDTTSEGIAQCEDFYFGEWVTQACKHYRREKVLIADRVLKNKNVCEDLLWQKRRAIRGEGENRLFLDLRNPCVSVLLDNEGFAVSHDVLREPLPNIAKLSALARMITEKEGASPAVVLDACAVTDEYLTQLGAAGIHFFVIRDSQMLHHMLDNIFRARMSGGHRDDVNDSSSRLPEGDVVFYYNPRRGKCRTDFAIGRAVGQGHSRPVSREWFLRTNMYSGDTAGTLCYLHLLLHARQRLTRCSGGTLAQQSRRTLTRDAFVSLLAYRLSLAIDEVINPAEKLRGRDMFWRFLKTHSAVAAEISAVQGGAAHTEVLVTEPRHEVLEIYDNLGMRRPCGRGSAETFEAGG